MYVCMYVCMFVSFLSFACLFGHLRLSFVCHFLSFFCHGFVFVISWFVIFCHFFEPLSFLCCIAPWLVPLCGSACQNTCDSAFLIFFLACHVD